MSRFDMDYMEKTAWTEQYLQLAERDFEMKSEPECVVVENAVILPTKAWKGLSWGAGGVIDAEGNYVEVSGVPTAFGGKYPFDTGKVQTIDETVIFLGAIPKHWGHFLIDSICRIWYALEQDPKSRIVFCGFGWQSAQIDGNFREAFRLLGIEEDRLSMVTEPVRYRKVLIPQPTMSFATAYHRKFRDIIVRRLTEAAVAEADRKGCPVYEKIYFTRRQFPIALLKEVGEEEVERCFEQNGFKVLAPEKLSLTEQIHYIHSCKHMASMSGTIPHNAIFASAGMKLTIINRICPPNHPQFLLNELFGIDCTYVDCFMPWMMRHARPYGTGVVWIGVTKHLKKYLADMGMTLPEESALIGAVRYYRQYARVLVRHFILGVKERIPALRRLKKWLIR